MTEYSKPQTATSAADVLTALAAASSSVDVNGQKIIDLGTPTADTDAATKAYVDAVAVGLIDPKASVRAATTANITLSGAQTIDGVSVIAGDRVLVKNQSTGANNGIYVCAAGAWSRSTDADISAEVTSGLYVFVEEGSSAADTGWILSTNNPIVLGTTVLTFVKFTSLGGDFVGPASSTDNAIVRFDGTGGKTGQGSLVTLSDADLFAVPNTSGSGFDLYSTADQSTNYVRMAMRQSGGNFTFQEEKGGSGSAGNVTMGAGTTGGNATFSALGTSLALNASSSNGTVTLNASVSSGAGPAFSLTNGVSFTSGSAVQVGAKINVPVNQSGTGGYTGLSLSATETATGSGAKNLAVFDVGGTARFSFSNGGTLTLSGNIQLLSSTSITEGGTTGNGIKFSSTANFGLFGGSGAPSLSAAKGSLYLRSDGSGVNDRMYVNTDGGTTWTAVVTVA